ncbi:gliding-associated putative ABC transporter substrate-binding component GldG [Algoriphagus ratkowskyi]|uniref:Gliding motility-associated ABC transporter substrate-binding protein GldG n=1 Tax=Algoriphagus ratkowskyi TaxID=57028 RepID=A0A2W7RJ36_9BACT|nr:gliding motility-associated ABC transporter substrate-binding protein GldG [Algoriphagus ratkowskyi]PZX60251.1 gliding-associated putative ABC transporter substrate-binding component GldG [Algoriphagus ratkowskyi]TXD78072.1 gliding motility-associated ABC transporter substrate-binding protein GldG [Algoriphagus ratkowskyi]
MRKSIGNIAKPWVFLFGGILLFALLAQFLNFRIDLTEEKRYSLHPATEEVLEEITEPLHVEILLMGENLPGGMRRLQKSVEETVRTFNAYSPEKITYSYFDPLTLPEDDRLDFILSLADYGINPVNLSVMRNSGQQEQLIFPGILVSNAEYETGALVLSGERGMGQDQILNQSIENLEFELSNAIRKLISPESSTIAMVMGHGEMSSDEGFGMVEALDGDFELFKVPLEQAEKPADLANFKMIFIQGPKQSYTEREIYLLDQYVMGGGNLVVLLDGVAVEIENAGGEGTIAMPIELGLDNLLFRYGIRVNKDLVKDLNFGYIPVMGGNFGDQQQMVPLPWPFYILAGRVQDHPITKGLDVVQFRFASSLDTVKADGVIKTPLIFSSDYSQILPAPARVAFADMDQQPDVAMFDLKNLPLAYLLEGEFTSLYKNRFIPDGFAKADFKESGKGKVVVIGDGDVFQAQTNLEDGAPLALGEDQFSQTTYANKLFLKNLVQYLSDPEGIIASRTRTFQIRPLNKMKIAQQKTFWQGLNVLAPVFVLLVLGGMVWWIRNNKYTRKLN